jgi:hypothetical protein
LRATPSTGAAETEPGVARRLMSASGAAETERMAVKARMRLMVVAVKCIGFCSFESVLGSISVRFCKILKMRECLLNAPFILFPGVAHVDANSGLFQGKEGCFLWGIGSGEI